MLPVQGAEKACRARCQEDLLSTTRYVTWSLHTGQRATLKSMLSKVRRPTSLWRMHPAWQPQDRRSCAPCHGSGPIPDVWVQYSHGGLQLINCALHTHASTCNGTDQRGAAGLLHWPVPAMAGCARSRKGRRMRSQPCPSGHDPQSQLDKAQGTRYGWTSQTYRQCARWHSMHVHMSILIVPDWHALRQVAASQGNKGSEGSVMDVLEQTLWNRSLGAMSEEIVAALVCQIFEGALLALTPAVQCGGVHATSCCWNGGWWACG